MRVKEDKIKDMLSNMYNNKLLQTTNNGNGNNNNNNNNANNLINSNYIYNTPTAHATHTTTHQPHTSSQVAAAAGVSHFGSPQTTVKKNNFTLLGPTQNALTQHKMPYPQYQPTPANPNGYSTTTGVVYGKPKFKETNPNNYAYLQLNKNGVLKGLPSHTTTSNNNKKDAAKHNLFANHINANTNNVFNTKLDYIEVESKLRRPMSPLHGVQKPVEAHHNSISTSNSPTTATTSPISLPVQNNTIVRDNDRRSTDSSISSKQTTNDLNAINNTNNNANNSKNGVITHIPVIHSNGNNTNQLSNNLQFTNENAKTANLNGYNIKPNVSPTYNYESTNGQINNNNNNKAAIDKNHLNYQILNNNNNDIKENLNSHSLEQKQENAYSKLLNSNVVSLTPYIIDANTNLYSNNNYNLNATITSTNATTNVSTNDPNNLKFTRSGKPRYKTIHIEPSVVREAFHKNQMANRDSLDNNSMQTKYTNVKVNNTNDFTNYLNNNTNTNNINNNNNNTANNNHINGNYLNNFGNTTNNNNLNNNNTNMNNYYATTNNGYTEQINNNNNFNNNYQPIQSSDFSFLTNRMNAEKEINSFYNHINNFYTNNINLSTSTPNNYSQQQQHLIEDNQTRLNNGRLSVQNGQMYLKQEDYNNVGSILQSCQKASAVNSAKSSLNSLTSNSSGNNNTNNNNNSNNANTSLIHNTNLVSSINANNLRINDKLSMLPTSDYSSFNSQQSNKLNETHSKSDESHASNSAQIYNTSTIQERKTPNYDRIFARTPVMEKVRNEPDNRFSINDERGANMKLLSDRPPSNNKQLMENINQIQNNNDKMIKDDFANINQIHNTMINGMINNINNLDKVIVTPIKKPVDERHVIDNTIANRPIIPDAFVDKIKAFELRIKEKNSHNRADNTTSQSSDTSTSSPAQKHQSRIDKKVTNLLATKPTSNYKSPVRVIRLNNDVIKKNQRQAESHDETKFRNLLNNNGINSENVGENGAKKVDLNNRHKSVNTETKTTSSSPLFGKPQLEIKLSNNYEYRTSYKEEEKSGKLSDKENKSDRYDKSVSPSNRRANQIRNLLKIRKPEKAVKVHQGLPPPPLVISRSKNSGSQDTKTTSLSPNKYQSSSEDSKKSSTNQINENIERIEKPPHMENIQKQNMEHTFADKTNNNNLDSHAIPIMKIEKPNFTHNIFYVKHQHLELTKLPQHVIKAIEKVEKTDKERHDKYMSYQQKIATLYAPNRKSNRQSIFDSAVPKHMPQDSIELTFSSVEEGNRHINNKANLPNLDGIDYYFKSKNENKLNISNYVKIPNFETTNIMDFNSLLSANPTPTNLSAVKTETEKSTSLPWMPKHSSAKSRNFYQYYKEENKKRKKEGNGFLMLLPGIAIPIETDIVDSDEESNK